MSRKRALRIRGIAVRVHWSLWLALPFFALLMAQGYFVPEGGRLTVEAIAWGALLAVTLFLSVLLHELSHSFMAIHYGGRVRGITLLPIGGVSQIEAMPHKPRQEFFVSVVGPLTNFVIALPLLGLPLLGLLSGLGEDILRFLLWVGRINVGIGAFNLFFPAFPLDGGRILRAALAARHGLLEATRRAAMVGRALAFLLGLLGLLTFQAGGIWLLVIALFVYAGAGAEHQAVVVEEALRGLHVADIMTPNPVALRPDETLSDAFDRMVETKHVEFPVVDADGRLVGALGLSEMGRTPRDRFHLVRVADALRRDVDRAAPEALVSKVLQGLHAGRRSYVAVVEGDRLVGLVTATDLTRIVQIVSSLQGAGRAAVE